MLNKVININRLNSLKQNQSSQKGNGECKQNLHCMWVKQLHKKRQGLVKNWVNSVDGTGALATRWK